MRARIATVFLCVVLAPFGLACIYWAAVSLGRSDYATVLVSLGAAIFTLGFAAFLVIVASGKVTPRVTLQQSGLLIRPDRRVDALLTTSTFAAFLTMALYAVLAPLDMVDIPAPRGNHWYSVIACAAGALAGLVSIRQICKRRGVSYLFLTVDELEIGSATSSAKRSWNEVTDVSDRPRNSGRSTGTTYVITNDGRSRTLPTDWYTPGGLALRDLVRLYLHHPESRSELADDRGLERLETVFRDPRRAA
ncbi:hypothetical protein [Mycolicibacterium sp. P1-18]|uniref:hypothetical protein n=1 Tax=Mycolicibacterium sp. P1-18 TaxID=2024615 RepID=UPI0011F1AF16|nr:hypothetical protein [Mycolicibacterium sp. P1-18]